MVRVYVTCMIIVRGGYPIAAPFHTAKLHTNDLENRRYSQLFEDLCQIDLRLLLRFENDRRLPCRPPTNHNVIMIPCVFTPAGSKCC